ncbi:hypothetical protein NCS52_01227200 [Fusarium sp. LHS14.1]|nr:hypothetical protein NCS52_01227200 [Fusarium sp. LHS14.1]
MRSFFALGALALSGSIELAAAANCRPSGTTTSAAPSSSETGSFGGNKVVRNLVANGGCNELNPNDPSDIPNFFIEGGGQGVTGQGYTGGGSKETNCASLTANATPRRKRAVGPSVTISQEISDLDTATFYTIQFFYRITSHPSNGACLLTASLGESQFYSEYVSDSQAEWNKVLQRTTPTQETSAISIKMTCEGDYAAILVDSIFVSDAVTPDTIDDYVLDFGDGGAQQTDATTGSVTASETGVETASESDAQTQESVTETTEAATVIETSSAEETTTAEETAVSSETSSAFETTTVAETSSAAETSAADEITSVEETSTTETSTAEVEATTVTSAASETTSAAEEEEESTTTTPSTETTSVAKEEDQTTTASTSAATATDGCLPSTWDDGPVFCEPKLETEDTFCAVQGNAPSTAFELLDVSRYPWQGYAERCATICQQTEGCKVFGYTDERCAIASVNTVSDIEWESGGDEADMMEWSNLDCFVCDETCIVTDI